jgi:apolipoprotein N-acyltransferase
MTRRYVSATLAVVVTMASKTKNKIVGFAALIVLCLLVAGSDVARPMVSRFILVYVTGASIAFWAGGDPIGTFRPLSMRPLCILLGVVMMLYAVSMTLVFKGAIRKKDRVPNHALQVKTNSVLVN